MSEKKSAFGPLLKKYRQTAQMSSSTKKFSQEELGHLIGNDRYREWTSYPLRVYLQPEISKWERGVGTLPSRDTIKVIIDILFAHHGINSIRQANLLLNAAGYKDLSIDEAKLISDRLVKQSEQKFLTDKLELDAKIWHELDKPTAFLYKEQQLVRIIREQIEQSSLTPLAQEFLSASIDSSLVYSAQHNNNQQVVTAIKWVVASLISWIVTTVIFVALEPTIFKAILMGGVLGLSVGFFQYQFVLKRKFSLAHRWILTCFVGWTISFVILYFVPSGLDIIKPYSVPFEGSMFWHLLGWPIIGAVIGAIQWTFLRNILKNSWWWIPINSIAWFSGWGVAILSGYLSQEIFGALAGMVSELILAFFFVRLIDETSKVDSMDAITAGS